MQTMLGQPRGLGRLGVRSSITSSPMIAARLPQQPGRAVAVTSCSLHKPAQPLGSIGRVSGAAALQRSSTRPSLRRQPRQQGLQVAARARDPDELEAEDEEELNKGPPSLFWRVFSAFCYLVPWIDSISMGKEIYRRFRNLLIFYYVPGPFAQVYFSSQFSPLIIFFVMFLSVVKNKKLHHFVRFNCMQAIMLDIVVMLFHILKSYLPAEVKWSVISKYIDMFAWTCCLGTVIYCVFWTLRGFYADIPFVSESVYHQVQLSDYA